MWASAKMPKKKKYTVSSMFIYSFENICQQTSNNNVTLKLASKQQMHL